MPAQPEEKYAKPDCSADYCRSEGFIKPEHCAIPDHCITASNLGQHLQIPDCIKPENCISREDLPELFNRHCPKQENYITWAGLSDLLRHYCQRPESSSALAYCLRKEDLEKYFVKPKHLFLNFYHTF